MESLPSKELLERCASAWDLTHITFIRKMENIVFSCDTPQGKAFLRLTTPLRRSLPEIEAEIHWIEHLATSGLATPRVIPDKRGRKVASFSEENNHYEAVVFAEVKGEHPSEELATDPAFLEKLGVLVANMHQASKTYPHPKTRREEWFEERGLRHARAAAALSSYTALREALDQEILWLQTLPKTTQTYGLIHADLGALNLFIHDDHTISVIDFDDSCYHFFAFDLAIILFSMKDRLKRFDPAWQIHLLKGYRSICPFEEDSLIPRLIRFASLRLFFWIAYHESLHTFHPDALPKIQNTQQWLLKQLTAIH